LHLQEARCLSQKEVFRGPAEGPARQKDAVHPSLPSSRGLPGLDDCSLGRLPSLLTLGSCFCILTS
jgi:hypothetical protein